MLEMLEMLVQQATMETQETQATPELAVQLETVVVLETLETPEIPELVVQLETVDQQEMLATQAMQEKLLVLVAAAAVAAEDLMVLTWLLVHTELLVVAEMPPMPRMVMVVSLAMGPTHRTRMQQQAYQETLVLQAQPEMLATMVLAQQEEILATLDQLETVETMVLAQQQEMLATLDQLETVVLQATMAQVLVQATLATQVMHHQTAMSLLASRAVSQQVRPSRSQPTHQSRSPGTIRDHHLKDCLKAHNRRTLHHD